MFFTRGSFTERFPAAALLGQRSAGPGARCEERAVGPAAAAPCRTSPLRARSRCWLAQVQQLPWFLGENLCKEEELFFLCLCPQIMYFETHTANRFLLGWSCPWVIPVRFLSYLSAVLLTLWIHVWCIYHMLPQVCAPEHCFCSCFQTSWTMAFPESIDHAKRCLPSAGCVQCALK